MVGFQISPEIEDKKKRKIREKLCCIWNIDVIQKSPVLIELSHLIDYTTIQDPSKIVFISNEGVMLFLLHKNGKNIRAYSLEDGSLIMEIITTHSEIIEQFIVSKDHRYLVSCSKDKKI